MQSDAGWGDGQQGNPVINRLHSRIPTLMLPENRKPSYGYEDLNLPVGAMAHPLALANSRNATQGLGWRDEEHSDYAVGALGDANSKMWFPGIWYWYEQVVQPAIFINEE